MTARAERAADGQPDDGIKKTPPFMGAVFGFSYSLKLTAESYQLTYLQYGLLQATVYF